MIPSVRSLEIPRSSALIINFTIDYLYFYFFISIIFLLMLICGGTVNNRGQTKDQDKTSKKGYSIVDSNYNFLLEVDLGEN